MAPSTDEAVSESLETTESLGPPPTMWEVSGWHLYSLCSYFVHNTLLPVLFPLIISFAVRYQSLTEKNVHIGGAHFTPLTWTSLSWALGLVLTTPILALASSHLDLHGTQRLYLAVATLAGSFICLITGAFKTPLVFAFYIAAIVAADAVAAAAHTRHLGFMSRRLAPTPVRVRDFLKRAAVTSRLCLHATAFGSMGSSIISVFTYHMLRRSDPHTSLRVASILCGLKWFLGILHVFSANITPSMESSLTRRPSALTHVVSVFRYSNATGCLIGVLLSSFATSCIFSGSLLYIFGGLCMKPTAILVLWMVYLLFPTAALPALYVLQLVMRTDAVRMQFLAFLLSAVTSGVGFYFRNENWLLMPVLLGAVIQSVAAGLLHAFGRVLLLHSAPSGKEGAFSAWLAWVKAAGTAAGFAVSAAYPGNVKAAFGLAFCGVVAGVVVLVLGNVSELGGAKDSGFVVVEADEDEPKAEEEVLPSSENKGDEQKGGTDGRDSTDLGGSSALLFLVSGGAGYSVINQLARVPAHEFVGWGLYSGYTWHYLKQGAACSLFN